MQTNAKYNEHPRCGCFHCRHAHGKGVQAVHRAGNRRIRHQYKAVLQNADETPLVIIATPPVS